MKSLFNTFNTVNPAIFFCLTAVTALSFTCAVSIYPESFQWLTEIRGITSPRVDISGVSVRSYGSGGIGSFRVIVVPKFYEIRGSAVGTGLSEIRRITTSGESGRVCDSPIGSGRAVPIGWRQVWVRIPVEVAASADSLTVLDSDKRTKSSIVLESRKQVVLALKAKFNELLLKFK